MRWTLVGSGLRRKVRLSQGRGYHSQPGAQASQQPFSAGLLHRPAPTARPHVPRNLHSPLAKLHVNQALGSTLSRQVPSLLGALYYATPDAARAFSSWLKFKAPSFAATPVFNDLQRAQQEAAEGSDAQAPRGPVVYRKNYRLVSNPLYRFAQAGMRDREQPVTPEDLAPSATVEGVMRKYVKLDTGKANGVTKTKPRLSARAALKAFANLSTHNP